MPKNNQAQNCAHEYLKFSTEMTAVPAEIQLFPWGKYAHPKGIFEINKKTIELIMANFDAHARDVAIDYEHQSLLGGEAPAAGWIKRLVNKGKEGLWAVVEWTQKAAGYLKAREYRYISPVLELRAKDPHTGAAIGMLLHSAALTNTPFLPGMTPVIAKLNTASDEAEEENSMNEKIIGLLGLKPEASLEEIETTVAYLKKRAVEADKIVACNELLRELGCKPEATLEDVRAGIVDLKKTQADTPDPAKYVPLKDFQTMQTDLAVMRQERADEKATSAVESALLAGKLTPAQSEWALAFAGKDPEGFGKFVECAPQVVPMSELVRGKAPARDAAPDDTQLAMNRQLGITAEDWKKYNPLAN